ncbi:MAG TPA: acetyl-CoA carboxylase biotin carboxyl carrier protein [Bacillota bacterium]|nr:acetyl-CoA carboxylase biotin carboxyl carrier protein [Bacillota bacterium]
MNIKEIKELVKLLVETDISELNLESDGTKIVIKKGAPAGNLAPAPIQTSVSTIPTQTPPPVSAPAPANPSADKSEGLGPNQVLIVAPMVGTFYRSPSPDTDPYIEVGQTVEPGQVVCIIEAMKLMNEIESEFKGKISEILVENAQPVEYGQPLFIVDKA